MSYGVVYKITNTVNEKVYVGQTIQRLNDRWRGHIKQVNKDSKYPLHSAIRLHGKENFNIEILCECSTQEELDSQEVYWGFTLNALAPNGYNCKLGIGKGTVSEESRVRISESHADVSGEKNPFFGKKHTKETLDKISKTSKERVASLEARSKMSKASKGRKKPIETVNKIIESLSRTWYFISPAGEHITIRNLAKFCRDNNLGNGNMSNVANGKLAQYKGWRRDAQKIENISSILDPEGVPMY